MIKNCKYATCGRAFETKRRDKQYCCDSHRALDIYYQKKKNLAGVQTSFLPAAPAPVAQNQSTLPMRAEKMQPPTQDIAAKWVIDQQKERIGELKDELKQKDAELKTLAKEKNQLEKDLASARQGLDEKPKGLSGFLQNNPSFLEKGMELFGPAIANVVEKLTTAPALNGNNEITNWILSQPENVQAAFAHLIQALSMQPDRIADNLHNLVAQLMQVSTKKEIHSRRSY